MRVISASGFESKTFDLTHFLPKSLMVRRLRRPGPRKSLIFNDLRDFSDHEIYTALILFVLFAINCVEGLP